MKGLELGFAMSMVAHRKTYKERRKGDLKELLDHSRLCKASEQRDKVYAFIGLADPEYNISSDYDSTIEEVFTHTCPVLVTI
jgi:hypothetical protein